MPNVPKAVLYYSPTSVWSAVVLLALEEKGYAPDEIDFRVVDLGKGENFDPTFLRLNPKATVPVLVVPYENSLTDEDSRYKALTEPKVIVEFLDKSRSALSHTHSTSSAPAPSLTPATIASLTTCKIIVDEILHTNEANPNTLRYANARDDSSLRVLAKDVLPTLQQRKAALSGYLAQSEKGEIKVSEKIKNLWTEKLEATSVILTVLEDAEKPDSELDGNAHANRVAFYKTAKQAWEINLGGKLLELSKEMVGTYALGDQFSIADLHLSAWLTRIVRLCGGSANDNGSTIAKKIEEHVAGGLKIPRDFLTDVGRREGPKAEKQTKIGAFWDAIRERPSWQKVYAGGLYYNY